MADRIEQLRQYLSLPVLATCVQSSVGALLVLAAVNKALEFKAYSARVLAVGRSIEIGLIVDHALPLAGLTISFELVLGAMLLLRIAPRFATTLTVLFLLFVTLVAALARRSGTWQQPCGCGLAWLEFADVRYNAVRNAVLAALAEISCIDRRKLSTVNSEEPSES